MIYVCVCRSKVYESVCMYRFDVCVCTCVCICACLWVCQILTSYKFLYICPSCVLKQSLQWTSSSLSQLDWLASKSMESGSLCLTPDLSPWVTHSHFHSWPLKWALGIQTQVFRFSQQALLPLRHLDSTEGRVPYVCWLLYHPLEWPGEPWSRTLFSFV